MGGEHEERCFCHDGLHSFVGLLTKAPVASAEDFVDQQELRLDAGGDRKAEAQAHATGIGAQRQIEEIPKLAEFDNVRRQITDGFPAQTQHSAAQLNVLVACRLRVESQIAAEKGRYPAIDILVARAWSINPGKRSKERALAGAILADQADAIAWSRREGNVVENPDLSFGRLV